MRSNSFKLFVSVVFIIVLCGIETMKAQTNVLSIGNCSGAPGETITIGINMDNEDKVAGLQFDVVLPPTVTFVDGSVVLTDRKSQHHVLVSNMINANTLRVLSYSMPIGEYSGTTGDVVTFQVTLGNAVGQHPIRLEGAALSDYIGQMLNVTTGNGAITIQENMGVIDNEGQEVQVYPNPARKEITVKCRGMKNLKIVSSSGTVVKEIKGVKRSQCTVNVKDLKQGQYVLEVTKCFGRETKRFVKLP